MPVSLGASGVASLCQSEGPACALKLNALSVLSLFTPLGTTSHNPFVAYQVKFNLNYLHRGSPH